MDFKQTSFSGGLNLLLEDSRLPVTVKNIQGSSPYEVTYSQYRYASNVRTRFDVVTPVKQSIEDKHAPTGLKQGLLTFGNYLILFCAGSAYFRLNTETAWTLINNFSMSTTAPRYWTVTLPLTTTNYYRQATTNNSLDGVVSKNLVSSAAAEFGNIPGLLVQDGVNQPRFLYVDNNNIIQCRVTQTYEDWTLEIAGDGTTVLVDKREYVPIGTFMAWCNGVLFIVSQDYNTIYRSVSGRPLDFMVNVDVNGQPGGDATTTSYSVGVGAISALKAMPGNTLFIAAGGGSCFSVSFNQTPNAPTIFGEYTFNRQFLFNANCVTELGIIDISGSSESSTSGDTVFIDANGIRSFNAILQQQNEGRNSVFSSTIHSLFNNVIQQANLCSAINFDNYVMFSVNTVSGYVLVVYDTITNCYTSIDQDQVGNVAIKQFAQISIDYVQLFAITDDNKVYQLFGADSAATPSIRLGAASTQDPKKEIRVSSVRAIFTNITEDFEVTCYLFTNNRLDETLTTKLSYANPVNTYSGPAIGSDINAQTNSLVFPFTKSNQGWKAFVVMSWTGGASLASVSMETQDVMPMQSPVTQAVVKQT